MGTNSLKSEYYKRWREANLEHDKARKRQYSIDNKQVLNSQTRQWHKANPERSLFITARNRANKMGLPFSIEMEDIVIPTLCPVLNIPLVISVGKRTDNTPSLDKVIPEKGYVPGNINVISWRANRLKNDATLEELERLCEYIRKG